MAFNQVFKSVRKRIEEEVEAITEVRWDAGQDQGARAQIVAKNTLLIRFLTTDTSYRPGSVGIQNAVIDFDATLVSDSLEQDDAERIEEHYQISGLVHKALSGFSAKVSYLPGNEALEGTEADWDLHNSMMRTQIEPLHITGPLVKTRQRFRCFAYDYTALIGTTTRPRPDIEITVELAISPPPLPPLPDNLRIDEQGNARVNESGVYRIYI